jgi:hypothetical protein
VRRMRFGIGMNTDHALASPSLLAQADEVIE